MGTQLAGLWSNLKIFIKIFFLKSFLNYQQQFLFGVAFKYFYLRSMFDIFVLINLAE